MSWWPFSKDESKETPVSAKKWTDYYFAVGKILGDNSAQALRKDIARWFSESIIAGKFKSKLQTGMEHEVAIHETLNEQTGLLRERLKKADGKLKGCLNDVEAALMGRPTITSPRLPENELYALKSDIVNFQMCITQMEQFIGTREARISKRYAWQTWVKDFVGDIEVPLRNIEAGALRLQTFLDRHQ